MNTNRRNMNTNPISINFKTIPTIPTQNIRPVYNFSDYVIDHTISKKLIHKDELYALNCINKNVSQIDSQNEKIMKDESKDVPIKVEKIKRKKIPKHIKTLVWNEYIGVDIVNSKCLSCKYENINIRNFHCGHVIAESKGGDSTIKNLRPICAACNSSMGTMSMSEFTKTYFGRDV